MIFSHIGSKWLWVVLLTLLLVACKPKAEDPIPAVAVVPSSTITPTRTITPSPTETPTSTVTDTPTSTPTYTLTPSATFTLTPTETATLTPTLTDTPTATFTLTPTETSTNTLTPTRTPTNTRTPTRTRTPTVVPTITLFTVEPPNAPSGGLVITRWEADADTVTLEQLTSSNVVINTTAVPAKGERSFTVSAENAGNQVTFRLTAVKGGNSMVRTVTISVQCASPWFLTPAPQGCPTQAAQSGGFTFQAFERGLAFYVPNNNNVYFLANDAYRANAYPSEWNAGVVFPTVIAPAGSYYQPTAQIGYVWQNKAWSDGRSVASVVGWAITQPQNYNGTFQVGNPASDVYIRRPDGAVYKLALAGSGIWAAVGNAP